MSEAPLVQDPTAMPPSWPMYRALVGVGVVCGLLIVSVFVVTLPIIARNEAAALQAAVFEVLPGAVTRQSFVLTSDGVLRPAVEGDDPRQMVHAGYDSAGELAGLAIQGEGMGYQDVIRILYGYAPERQAIIGMQVLASKETPGLGDAIEKDPVFLKNFTALDVSLAADGTSLAHPVEAVKRGAKTAAWQVDGITGATISSVAIAKILREGSAYWVPLLYPRRAEFAAAGGLDEQP